MFLSAGEVGDVCSRDFVILICSILFVLLTLHTVIILHTLPLLDGANKPQGLTKTETYQVKGRV